MGGKRRSTVRWSVSKDGVTRQVIKEETSGINKINTFKLQSVVLPIHCHKYTGGEGKSKNGTLYGCTEKW